MKRNPSRKDSFQRRWDWYAAVVFVALMYTTAGRLSVTSWARELHYVEPIAVLGAVLGLVLGFSKFDRRMVRWLVFEYSIVFIPWQLTRLVEGEMPAWERIYSTGGRLLYSFGLFFRGQPIDDPIFFVTLMSVLFWGIGVYCGHRLMSGGGILGVFIPPTIPLLVVQYYDGYRADRLWMIAFYFFLALLLVGRVNLLRNRENWHGRRVFTGGEPEFDLTNSMLVTAAIVVIIAWSFPTPAAALPVVAHFWQRINEPFQETRERIGDMLAALSGPVKVSGELYGSTLSLGKEANEGASEMFSVTPPTFGYPRYYWRARVYDTYGEGQWTISETKTQPFLPEQSNLHLESATGETGSFYFNWKTNRTTLFIAPSQPVWVSRSSKIQYQVADEDRLDVITWRPEPAIQPGDLYQVRSLLINPTLADLRSAGTDYPEWVTKRYLQIPDSLSTEIRNLAQNLTSGKTTPYDKAEAITNYLHGQITYSLTIPSPPPGIRQLDWFLFIWKSGYCNYYATAEVMMLRSAGVPARLAVGYAQGEIKDGAFTVRGRDSHAWPEVYFPGVGWVEFEPTTSQDPIIRPVERTPEETGEIQPPTNPLRGDRPLSEPEFPEFEEESDTANTRRFRVSRTGWWVIISVVVAAIGYGIWRYNKKSPLAQRIPLFVRRQYQQRGLAVPPWVERWVRWSESSSVERSFHAINQSLAWLGKPQPPHVTPVERAQLLKALVPLLAEDVDLLTQEHEQTLFGQIPGDPVKAAQAAWRIRYSTLRSIMRRWFVGEEDEH